MPTMIGAARATIPATTSTIFFAKLSSAASRPAKIGWIRFFRSDYHRQRSETELTTPLTRDFRPDGSGAKSTSYPAR